MPAIIPSIIKDEIFQSWLGGSFRKSIAANHGISEGTVSNVVAERKLQYGSDLLDAYRSLSTAISRSGLTVTQCADGHRVAMIIKNMGAEDCRFEEFIAELWQLHVNAGLSPEDLVKQIDELYYFRESNQSLHGAVSIPRICENISALKAKEKELRDTIALLEPKKGDLENMLSNMQTQKATLEAELAWDTEFKNMLDAIGFRIEKIPKLKALANLVIECGYSIEEIAEKFSTLRKLENASLSMDIMVVHAGVRHDQLVRDNAIAEDLLAKNSQKIRELESLRSRGFGLPELKHLQHLIDEISREDDTTMEHNAAVKKFFQDLEENYDDYLNLGKKVDERKSEIKRISNAIHLLSVTLNLTPEVMNMIKSLACAGIKKDDIENLKRLIKENRLPRTENPPAKNTTPVEYHSESVTQGEKIVTENSLRFSKPEPNLTIDESRANAEVVAKPEVDTCNTDSMNLQQLFAHFHGNHPLCLNDKFSYPLETHGDRVEQSHNLRKISKKLPRFPLGIRKNRRRARLKLSLDLVRKESEKTIANHIAYHYKGRQLIHPNLDVSRIRFPPSPNIADPRSRDHESPTLIQDVKPTIDQASFCNVIPSTGQEEGRPIPNIPSSHQSKLGNGQDYIHLDVGALLWNNVKPLVDDALRRMNSNKCDHTT